MSSASDAAALFKMPAAHIALHANRNVVELVNSSPVTHRKLKDAVAEDVTNILNGG